MIKKKILGTTAPMSKREDSNKYHFKGIRNITTEITEI